MHTAQLGDRVRVQYVRVCEPVLAGRKTPGGRAVEFTVGERGVPTAISFGVVGMSQGQCKRMAVAPGQAFGAVKPRLIYEIPRHRFPASLRLHVGQRLSAVGGATGERRRVTVVRVGEESVTVDGNHPLAGKAVEFDVTLITVCSSSDANAGKKQFDAGGEG